MLQKIGDWDKLNKLLGKGGADLTKAMNHFGGIATRRAGLIYQRNIILKIRTISSPPNSPLTIRYKGSSKPLIDEGDLWRSIVVIPLAETTVWVGIPEGKGKTNGITLARIAKILEGGEVGDPPRETVILPKKARSLFIPLRKGIEPNQPGLIFGEDFIFAKRIVIKPRPFMTPALKTSAKDMEAQYEQAIKLALRSLIQKV